MLERGPKAGHHAPHEIRQLAVGLTRLAAKRLRGPGPFSPQHRPQVQPFKKGRGHDPDGPTAEVPAFVAQPPRLSHCHEAGLFELPDGTLTTALAETGIPDNDFHIDVDESIGQSRDAKAQGCKIEVGEQRFQDHEAGLAAFAPGLAVTLGQKQWTFFRMVVPDLGPLGGQREDAREAPLALTNRVGGLQPCQRQLKSDPPWVCFGKLELTHQP